MSKPALIGLLVLLAGCSSVLIPHPVPLAEELADKTPLQKQEILRLACLNGAEKITGRTSMWKSTPHGAYYVYDAEISEMKGLCRAMTKAYFPKKDAKLVPLVRECTGKIEQKLASDNSNAGRLKTMARICIAFTNEMQ